MMQDKRVTGKSVTCGAFPRFIHTRFSMRLRRMGSAVVSLRRPGRTSADTVGRYQGKMDAGLRKPSAALDLAGPCEPVTQFSVLKSKYRCGSRRLRWVSAITKFPQVAP